MGGHTGRHCCQLPSLHVGLLETQNVGIGKCGKKQKRRAQSAHKHGQVDGTQPTYITPFLGDAKHVH